MYFKHGYKVNIKILIVDLKAICHILKILATKYRPQHVLT